MTYESLLDSTSQKYPNINLEILENVVGYVYDQLYDAAFEDGYTTAVADIKSL